MKAPAFWFRAPDRPGAAARALAPLAGLYAHATARRVARSPRHAPAVPVISVGNLSAGGTGKTPLVVALSERIGEGVQVISRGYGGRLRGPLRVDPRRHASDEVGDEPLLLSAFATVWVARDRAAAARAAERDGARVIVMDDGHQNPDVAKALSIVVVDAETGFGNGRVIPAGPLREPVAAGLARADLLVTIGSPAAERRFLEAWQPELPRASAELVPLETGMDWTGLRAFAFAGIGRPQKFFDTLAGLGAEIVGREALDDHAPLSDAMMARLQRRAEELGAQLVTTEKDAARLPRRWLGQVLTLPVRLRWRDDDAVSTALKRLGL